MPIKPLKNEKKSEFMSRCISKEIKSGKKRDQAAAICYSTWEDKKSKAKIVAEIPNDEIAFFED